MSASTVPAQPDEEVNPAALLQTLLDVSPTGLVLFRPVYAAADGAIIDFTFERVNLAAQLLLGLPERPAQSLLTLYPAAADMGAFAFCRTTYLAGQLAQHQLSYQHAGLVHYFQLAAQRQGPLLVVSFTDTNEQGRAALRESQAREQATRAEAEHQRQLLQAIVDQAPVAIGYFEGPELLVTAVNPALSAMWGRQQAEVLGRPLLEGVPELRGQGFEELMRQVRDTGVPFVGTEAPAQMLRDGEITTSYYNFVYQPLYDAQGRALGVIDVAVEVTEQVLARQQLEVKERQTNFLNGELQAANLEILANNAELERAQQQLRHLNEELEGRVRQRTQQLEEQQGLLRQILGQVPAFISTLGGPEHRFTFFNAPYGELMSGRPALGQPVAETLPELAEQGFTQLLDQVYASGQPYVSTETALLLAQPDGPPAQKYLNFTYQPLFDGQQQVRGILVFAVDITARVLARRQAATLEAAMLAVAQRQARQRQELFQIFEQTPVAIVLLREPDHRIDYFNPAFEVLFPPEEWAGGPLQGHTIAQVYPRLRLAGLVALLDRVFATGESHSVIDMPLANLQPGSPRFVTFAYQAYREQERIVGVAAFVYDTTEQVLARQARDARQAELRRIFEQAPVAITVLRGPQHTIELANEAICAIWGRLPSQVVGRSYFEAVPDTASQGFEQMMADVLRTGEPHFISEAPVTLDRAHTGRPPLGYFNFVLQSLRDEQQRPVGIVAIGTEVTEQVLARRQVQQLNEDLLATNARLTRTNADLDTFVYSASHDLKSPITNIEGLLLALREQLPPEALADALVPQLLAMMDGAVHRFQQTLGHLTDVSRLQQQALTDQAPEAVNLAALVEAVRLDILPELLAAGATLTVDVAACPLLYFSAKNLRSILYNLLSNAVKYRAPGRPALVQLGARYLAGGQAELTVQDNGLGLSPGQQEQLFRLFRRLHSHVSGSGVGLYMVKKIVDNGGGTIAVQSQPGVGSTFTVTLPVPHPPQPQQ